MEYYTLKKEVMFGFNKTGDDTMKKLSTFIEEGRYQIELQKRLFDTIDSKTQWFFLLISGTIGYLITNELDNIREISTLCSLSLIIFIVVILLGFFILQLGVRILNTKFFLTGPHLRSQMLNFGPDKKHQELIKNSAAAYIKSYVGNDETIRKKANLLRVVVNLTYIYSILIVIYFLIKFYVG